MRAFRLPSLRAFLKEECGASAMMLGLSFFALLASMGAAVDIGRFQLVQARLTSALDAAGLAAGATMNTANLTTELAKYMKVNFPTGYMGATEPQITSAVSDDKLVIDLTATTTVPTTMMGLFGYQKLTLTTKSQITRSASGLELVMALDVTGSMDYYGKLTALKSAATTMVNNLYGSKTSVPNLWIGLVPFSHTVNVGTSRLTTWIDQDDYATHGYGTTTNKTTWTGCVDARDSANGDVTDTPPSAQKYKVYYTPSTDRRPSPYSPYDWSGYNVNDWVYTWNTNGTPKQLNSCVAYGTCGPNMYCPPVMTPLTANKTTITSAISALTADGNTHVNLGAIWAWNMLSPNWRGTWGGEMDSSGLPLNYGTKHMNKAVILLTDGDNTMSQPYFTAYGYLSDDRLGSETDSNVARTVLNTKLTNVCSAMKNKGIYVYVIALGGSSDISSTARNVLKNCATASNYYFESPTASDLAKVFGAISDSLSNLRVSE